MATVADEQEKLKIYMRPYGSHAARDKTDWLLPRSTQVRSYLDSLRLRHSRPTYVSGSLKTTTAYRLHLERRLFFVVFLLLRRY